MKNWVESWVQSVCNGCCSSTLFHVLMPPAWTSCCFEVPGVQMKAWLSLWVGTCSQAYGWGTLLVHKSNVVPAEKLLGPTAMTQ